MTQGRSKLKTLYTSNHPLVDAARLKNIDVIKIFLARGIGVEDETMHMALLTASTDIEISKLLLERCSSNVLNIKDSDGNTLLHHRCDNNPGYETDAQMVKMLLEKGADPNIQNNQGYSPLHLAVQRKRPELVNLLLKQGADPLLDKAYWIASIIPGYESTPADFSMSPYGYNKDTKIIKNTLNTLLGIKTFLFTTLRIGANKGQKHLNYLLNNDIRIDQLPLILKKPYPELLKALIVYAAEQNRADVLHAIFINNYSQQQLEFLKNDRMVIKKICAALKANAKYPISEPNDKLIIIEKLDTLYPANKEILDAKASIIKTIKQNAFSLQQDALSLQQNSFFNKNTPPTKTQPYKPTSKPSKH